MVNAAFIAGMVSLDDSRRIGHFLSMRAVIQRVSSASVTVDGEVVGAIQVGLLVLLGVADGDGDAELVWLSKKIANLRIFQNDEGKMDKSVLDVEGGVLVVSQFTLHGDCRKGNRPNFMAAAPPEIAEPLYEAFADALRNAGLQVETGRFGAMMDVALVNDGPVTLVIDTP